MGIMLKKNITIIYFLIVRNTTQTLDLYSFLCYKVLTPQNYSRSCLSMLDIIMKNRLFSLFYLFYIYHILYEEFAHANRYYVILSLNLTIFEDFDI